MACKSQVIQSFGFIKPVVFCRCGNTEDVFFFGAYTARDNDPINLAAPSGRTSTLAHAVEGLITQSYSVSRSLTS